jgi:hypothetical protein
MRVRKGQSEQSEAWERVVQAVQDLLSLDPPSKGRLLATGLVGLEGEPVLLLVCRDVGPEALAQVPARCTHLFEAMGFKRVPRESAHA